MLDPLINVNASELNVYPNPILGNFKITVTTRASENITIDILDLNGRLVKHIFSGMSNGNVNLDLTSDGIPAGMYFVQLKSNSDRQIRKIVFQ